GSIAQKYRLMTDQVQDFTPTPMTFATALYYLGYNPYTGDKVHTAKTAQERHDQHIFFFPRIPENRKRIAQLTGRRNGQRENGR
ncbi:MAG: DUF3362 domain-containing protein, partial [Bacteroidales bacterium]|nr:DUF3362 domain-containing protein [Bacteroidales bacterium]